LASLDRRLVRDLRCGMKWRKTLAPQAE